VLAVECLYSALNRHPMLGADGVPVRSIQVDVRTCQSTICSGQRWLPGTRAT